MKKQVWRGRHYKVILERTPKSLLIQVYRKGEILMSGISETPIQLWSDREEALMLLQQKSPRKWLRRALGK